MVKNQEMKRIILLIAGLLILLLSVVLIRTFTFTSKQINIKQQQFVEVKDNSVLNLQKALQFKTISYDDASKIDSSQFRNFHAFLKTAYPLVFSRLSLEKVNELSLVLHWKNPKANNRTIVLMAHQDVVPIEEATRGKWDAAPFSGEIKNGYIYGRGAIDDKGSLIAILESVEILLQENHIPEIAIYFVFGHDEEVTGKNGAKAIANLFKQRNIKPEMVLDEGGIITKNKVPGLKKIAAVVGIAEKGYLTLDLKINIPGGHSSMPEQKTAIDEMAKAIVKLKENQFPANLGSVHQFLDYIGPEMPFISKMAMANRWLFSPLIKQNYSKTAAGNATLRTTTATTIFNSGIKENLIPGEATATINFRTQPGVTTEDVIAHIKKVIENKEIEIIIKPGSTESRLVADVNHPTFNYLHQSIASFNKDIVVAPYLVLGATDGRYFQTITPQVFRFIPFIDPEGFHGVNERLKVEDYKKSISFYYNFIKGYPIE